MPARSQRILEQKIAQQSKRKKHGVDIPLLTVILLLLFIGILTLFTASYSSAIYNNIGGTYYIIKQLQYMLMGLVVVWFLTTRINYHTLCKPWFVQMAFWGSIGLLALVYLVGDTHKGAKRWLSLGGFSFQPSEVMKLAMILVFAYEMTRNPKSVKRLPDLLKYYVLRFVLVAFLLFLEPHMSATMIIFAICFVMLYVGGIRKRYIVVTGLSILAVPAIYLTLKPYALQRVQVWIDPWVDFLGDGWQGAMSAIAIGSGGLFGMGWGQGRQKHLFLPEPQNDFIFSALSEEVGFLGSMLVMILFAFLVYRGFYVAQHARDRFGCLIATGITAQFTVQTLMNLFVVSGIAPVTGASLPLFSYGGTALLVQMAALGILLNISRYITKPQEHRG